MTYPSAKIIIILFISALLFLIGCSKKNNFDIIGYKSEIQQWQSKRAEGLKKDNGWLTLCGLFWLKEGENKMGSDSSNNVIFPSGKSPKYAGSIFVEKNQLHLKSAKDAKITVRDSLVTDIKLLSDQDGGGNPTTMSLGTLTFYVIKRGDQLGVRVKDKENPSRINFKGLDYFTIDTKWRIDANFEPYNPPKIIPIVNVLNQVSNDTCPGNITFNFDGTIHHLDALREGNELFIIFHDETSGKETYGMGRFLYTNYPDSTNKVVLDFNKAYNPPCAFTVFATCPTPPKQNYLPFRVDAGEKKYFGSGH